MPRQELKPSGVATHQGVRKSLSQTQSVAEYFVNQGLDPSVAQKVADVTISHVAASRNQILACDAARSEIRMKLGVTLSANTMAGALQTLRNAS